MLISCLAASNTTQWFECNWQCWPATISSTSFWNKYLNLIQLVEQDRPLYKMYILTVHSCIEKGAVSPFLWIFYTHIPPHNTIGQRPKYIESAVSAEILSANIFAGMYYSLRCAYKLCSKVQINIRKLMGHLLKTLLWPIKTRTIPGRRIKSQEDNKKKQQIHCIFNELPASIGGLHLAQKNTFLRVYI